MFMKLWRFLFGGCDHKWITKEYVNRYWETKDNVIGRKAYLQCEKCGNFKTQSL